MVPVVAALLLRKSRSGYSFVFVCLFVRVSIFAGVYEFANVSVYVCVYVRACVCVCEEEIIRMERVRDHIAFSLE